MVLQTRTRTRRRACVDLRHRSQGAKESIEFLAGGVEGALGILVEVPGNQWATVFMDLVENERAGIHRRRIRVVVTDFNEMTAKHPKVIAVANQRLARISPCKQVSQERGEHFDECLPERKILVFEAP